MASFVYSSNNDEEEDGVRYCSCCRFTNGIDLPSPGKLTGKEVLAEAPRYAGRILKKWILLKACLNRFEPIIRKRWAKKTDKQRREILLTAWPEIPKHHRPDFMGCRTRKKPTAIPREYPQYRARRGRLWCSIERRYVNSSLLTPRYRYRDDYTAEPRFSLPLHQPPRSTARTPSTYVLAFTWTSTARSIRQRRSRQRTPWTRMAWATRRWPARHGLCRRAYPTQVRQDVRA